MQVQIARIGRSHLGRVLLVWLAAGFVYVGYETSALTGSRPADLSVSISRHIGADWCQLSTANVKNPTSGEQLDVYNCWRNGEKACETVAGPIPVTVADQLFKKLAAVKRPACSL